MPQIYFPSEGRRAEDFFALKNPTPSAGFEPGNLGTKGQHATPRPPKLLICNNIQKLKHSRCQIQGKFLVFNAKRLNILTSQKEFWLLCSYA